MTVRRGFVDIAEGQIHYRHAGVDRPGRRPLVMLQPSPGSSQILVPLIERLGRTRRVIAPDMMGNGDSTPPAQAQPEIADYADAAYRAVRALGIDAFDLYGCHTGANLCTEIAIAQRERVGRIVFDGVSLFDAGEQRELLTHHAPQIVCDLEGTQLMRAWHLVRDAHLFWPWWKRTARDRRDLGLPPADDLHDQVLEVLKGVRSYHLSYRAALRYPKRERLPLIPVPVLVTCARLDMLRPYMEAAARLIPGARAVETPGLDTPADLDATAATYEAFLDRP